MTLTLYGIANCDTVKRARAWLGEHGKAYGFHDYKLGVPAALDAWVAELGWEALLNRQGTTFRKLPDVHKADLDAARAIALMRAYPSAIRRPVVVDAATLLVGFKPNEWASALA